MLVFENRNWHRGLGEYDRDITFFGDEGTMVISSAGYKMYDMAGKLIGEGSGRGGEVDHIPNLLQAIRDGTPLNAGIDVGYRSTLLCHLGAIAYRVGRSLKCDPRRVASWATPRPSALGAEYEPGWEPKV